ncbi:MAG: DUF2490 domain-containing protein [Prolixibacteraceae bacterium]
MKKVFALVVFAALLGNLKLSAQTENFRTWIELEFRKEFLDKFSFSLTPEIRLEDQFKADEFLFQGKLKYELLPFLDLAAAYRINTEVKKKGNENYYRWAFDAQVKQNIDRFEAKVRGRLTNFSDSSEEDPGTYFRPRAKLEYDIKNNKIRPHVSYEFFRNLTEAEWHKTRIDAGFTRNLSDIHRIELYYRLHNYFSDKTSVHILGIGYRLKF